MNFYTAPCTHESTHMASNGKNISSELRYILAKNGEWMSDGKNRGKKDDGDDHDSV